MPISYKPIPEPDRVAVERVLISVFDKTGIIEFAQALAGHGVEILSTGGTARALSDAGLAVTDVAKITEFPEILDGRVKTLHPAIHGGLLAIRGNAEHLSQLEAHGIAPIDMVVTNLYPFESVAEAGADFGEAIENIDIGGPAMIRASAKNHAYVCVVTQAEDYQLVLQDMEANGGATSLKLRRRLAANAFSRTAAYDCAVSDWFQRQLADEMPDRLTIGANRELSLRYGENPHQEAALYAMGEKRPGVATAERLQGRELSYNNINDADAAFELVSEFDPLEHAAVAIIKHANPCGVAVADDLATAYERALACDPVSAFGGIVALNRELDEAAARQIVELFTEVVIAPAASQRAREILAEKKNLRLLVTGELADPALPGCLVRTIAGGLLVQSRDSGRVERHDLKVVTKRQPNEGEIADALFAFRVAKHVKSNAIVYARQGATVGIGAGQMSRVDSARIAAWKAEEAAKKAGLEESLARGSVVASDAFFPFADGLLAAADAGATAVIQPGGSMRDDEVVAAADEAGLAMMLTGMRHFRH